MELDWTYREESRTKKNIASQLWNGGQKGKEGQVDPKQPGGE